jgi:hypothetical protein
MRLPRMTTRRWMIAVAAVALACAVRVALNERSRRFTRIAQGYDDIFIGRSGPISILRDRKLVETIKWRLKMGRKYRRAARYPWLPVEPDPPEPK